MSDKRPAPAQMVKIKFLTTGAWADSRTELRRPHVHVEKPGQVFEFSKETLEVIEGSGKGVLYKGDAEHGEVVTLTKDEQALAAAFMIDQDNKGAKKDAQTNGKVQ